MRSRRPRRSIGLVLAAAAISAGAAAPGSREALPALGFGYEHRADDAAPGPLADPSIAPDHPLYARIEVVWPSIEAEPGLYDWGRIDAAVDAYRAARYVVVLNLVGSNGGTLEAVPSPESPEVLKRWLGFARAAAQRFKGRARFYEIWNAPNRGEAWPVERAASFAYMLKNTSVTIRSADPEAFVVQGALAVSDATLEADLAWQSAVYRQDIATYVDALPIAPQGDLEVGRAVDRVWDLVLEHDPSAQVWVVGAAVAGETPRDRAADLLTTFVEAQAAGASLVTFLLESSPEAGVELPGVLLDIHKLFLPTYGRITGGTLRFEPYGETAWDLSALRSFRFYDSDTEQGLVVYRAPAPPAGAAATMVIDTAAVRGAAIYDIVGGAAGPARDARPDFRRNITTIPVPVHARPLILQYARVPIKGFEAEQERAQITESGLITAEEIITAHQAFKTDQDFRLHDYRAEGMLVYHGKIAGSNTVDIGIDVAFYWDDAGVAEWEQRALYYNGVLWRSDRLPPLPIPQVEKVFTLPLDINLNKEYRFEYVGREKVGAYDCYVLDFAPIDPARVLYRGRAWIETRTFAMVKTATVQNNLSPPVMSNEETDYYAPMPGPDGTTYWLLSRLEGQQILTVAGQNLVLLREIDFKNIQINDPGFEDALRRAHASERQILKETGTGMRYLQRTPSGERVLRDPPKSVLLGLAGLYRQPGLDYPVLPLLGAGYFNFDVRDRDQQITALLGGVVNLFSVTNPATLGTRLDTTVQVVTFAVNVTDQLFVRGEEREESNVDARTQNVSLGLGAPLGNFMRVRATYGLDYANHSRDADTKTFVVPADTWIQTPGVAWEFNRAAWTVALSGEKGYRSRWRPWGDTTAPGAETMVQFPASLCDTPGSCLAEFQQDRDTFSRYEASVAKQFFLPAFQKLRFEAVWQEGSRLDRFSEFQFSFFGNRARGFSGSGIRYDRGGIARAQYSFNIADIVRFDASVDYAYVRDSLTSDDFEKFTGFGVGGNLMGPWDTVLQFDVGVAVQSGYDALRGGTEFQVGILKYF